MTEPDAPDEAGPTEPDRPKQPPFPFVLFALCGFAGYSAITTEAGWIKVACFVGALLFAAAAIYQTRQSQPAAPRSAPEDPWDGVDERP